MEWETQIHLKFKAVLAKMPVFHRRIAEEAITKKALDNARDRGASTVQEEDLVKAFFSDVPSPFYSMMVRLLDNAGIEYRKFGFPKTTAPRD